MEPKPPEQYSAISASDMWRTRGSELSGHLAFVIGCTAEEAQSACGLLITLVVYRRRRDQLGMEINRLELLDLCNGWLIDRADGRTYCHHKFDVSCPHPEHQTNSERNRRYVGAANYVAWGEAIERYGRLLDAREELKVFAALVDNLTGHLAAYADAGALSADDPL